MGLVVTNYKWYAYDSNGTALSPASGTASGQTISPVAGSALSLFDQFNTPGNAPYNTVLANEVANGPAHLGALSVFLPTVFTGP